MILTKKEFDKTICSMKEQYERDTKNNKAYNFDLSSMTGFYAGHSSKFKEIEGNSIMGGKIVDVLASRYSTPLQK